MTLRSLERGVDYFANFTDPSVPNVHLVLQQGTTINLTWSVAWNASDILVAQPGNEKYAQLLSSGLSTQWYGWNVVVPAGVTDLSVPFQVGIIDSSKHDSPGNNYVSSPHFYIDHMAYSGDTSSGSDINNSKSNGTTSTTIASHSGLSTGAKAGIGVGVAVGVILIAALYVYCRLAPLMAW